MGLDAIFAELGFLLAAAAVVGFPIYGWLRDKKRRGEHVNIPALLGIALLGLLGLATLVLFASAKRLIRGY